MKRTQRLCTNMYSMPLLIASDSPHDRLNGSECTQELMQTYYCCFWTAGANSYFKLLASTTAYRWPSAAPENKSQSLYTKPPRNYRLTASQRKEYRWVWVTGERGGRSLILSGCCLWFQPVTDSYLLLLDIATDESNLNPEVSRASSDV